MDTCFECISARMCQTWGELKCIKKRQRLYSIFTEKTCPDFVKRTKGHILDTPCRCEDCLSARGEE